MPKSENGTDSGISNGGGFGAGAGGYKSGVDPSNTPAEPDLSFNDAADTANNDDTQNATESYPINDFHADMTGIPTEFPEAPIPLQPEGSGGFFAAVFGFVGWLFVSVVKLIILAAAGFGIWASRGRWGPLLGEKYRAFSGSSSENDHS